ncbi:MAG: hypothetical protein ABW124_05350 [Candidatus Thiodiazotropha sp. 6PLUC9]
MVSKTIVSRFTGDLPLDEEACRKIAGGPLYPADEVLALLAGSGAQAVQAWTRKCTADMQKWSLDTDDLYELMEIAVRSGRFRGAVWCVQRPNGPWAACDAYSLVRREWIAYARKEMDMEYYIKFAIAKTGKLLLVVSCHPPEDRR